jgi:uncharacterized membrane protein
MEDWIWVLVVLALFWAAPLVLALAAHSKATTQGSRIAALKARIEGLETQLVEIRRPPAASMPEIPAPPPVAAGEVADVHPLPLPAGPAEPVAVPQRGEAAQRSPLEERLASRWLLWLGAAALALSGLFLINYAVESGLLTPTTRIVLALLLGIALTLGGEWTRRRSLPRYLAAARVDLVSGALTSAGIFVSFAAVYAAHSLYGLISPLVAFMGLALIALVAFALAALHASIVAILGLLAGFLTPALVRSELPSAWALFGYLAVVVLACAAVVRYRHWSWLAFGAIAGGAIWTIIWIDSSLSPPDIVPVTAFQALLAGAMIYLVVQGVDPVSPAIWAGIRSVTRLERAAWAAIASSSILIAAAIDAARISDFNLAILGLIAAIAVYAGRHWQRFDAIILFVSLPPLIIFMLAPLGAEIEAARLQVTGISGPPFEGLIASAVWPYFLRAILFAFLLAFAGYVAQEQADRPQVWAGISAIAAALLLVLVYVRLREVTADRLWASIATASAFLALLAARRLNADRIDHGRRVALAVYSAAVVAGTSFAFALVFRNAWLTIALALQIPALAWLEERLRLRELRLFALALAGIVLFRLVVNPYILGYDADAILGTQWILYGYGLPALAFFVGSLIFRRAAADLTVTVLEAGALAFALLLMAFEIRLLIEGKVDSPHLSFLELSLHTLVWLATGWWRGRAYAASGRAVDGWYAAILLALGAFGVLVVQLLFLNPALTLEYIGEWPVIDKLLLGYLAPAVLLVVVARDLGDIPRLSWLRPAAGIGALILAFAWVTLETKHLFQGPKLAPWHRSDGEYYAYSVVWLLFAFLLLAAGLWRRQPKLRYGALAVLLITVLKVFISDMAGLQGLYRVASFLGLGLSLVAIGWIYQRFVYPRAPEAGTRPASA